MSSLYGYLFGPKNAKFSSSATSDTNTNIGRNGNNDELVHTFLEDDGFILVTNKTDYIVATPLENQLPSTPTSDTNNISPQYDEDFEQIQMSIANLVDFIPTLSSHEQTNRNSIRTQIMEDESMKERFRLFLQEQHQQSILRGTETSSPSSRQEVSSDSELLAPSSPISEPTPISTNSNNTATNGDTIVIVGAPPVYRSRPWVSSAHSTRSSSAIISLKSTKIIEQNRFRQIRRKSTKNNSNNIRKQSSTSYNHSREGKNNSRRFQTKY